MVFQGLNAHDLACGRVLVAAVAVDLEAGLFEQAYASFPVVGRLDVEAE